MLLKALGILQGFFIGLLPAIYFWRVTDLYSVKAWRSFERFISSFLPWHSLQGINPRHSAKACEKYFMGGYWIAMLTWNTTLAFSSIMPAHMKSLRANWKTDSSHHCKKDPSFSYYSTRVENYHGSQPSYEKIHYTIISLDIQVIIIVRVAAIVLTSFYILTRNRSDWLTVAKLKNYFFNLCVSDNLKFKEKITKYLLPLWTSLCVCKYAQI